MNPIIIIPARYASSRIPGKPLVDINGKPMILHVLDRARESGINRIIVATDHEYISNVVKLAGGEVCITNTNHNSGIERIMEVIEKYNFHDKSVVINIQCDEPMMPPAIIHQVAKDIINCKAEVTTFAVFIHKKEADNPNIVKVVIDSVGHALYFSRALIPWYSHNFLKKRKKQNNDFFLRHIGIYGYRASLIREYIKWSPSPLEKIENLEQLRILWYGKKIYVSTSQSYYLSSGVSVDTFEDLRKVRTKMI